MLGKKMITLPEGVRWSNARGQSHHLKPQSSGSAENGHWNNSKTPSDLITVEANSSTLCTDFVEITKANYPISMTTSRIRPKLSFNPQKLGYGYKEREKLVYILTVNTFLVNCQGSQMQMVYSFFSDISSGHKIIKSPGGQRITT